MHDSDSISASPKGTVKGYSVVGRKLVTVTPSSASSDDSLIDSLLQITFPRISPAPGETLREFAERVAEAAGLTVAKWEMGGEEA